MHLGCAGRESWISKRECCGFVVILGHHKIASFASHSRVLAGCERIAVAMGVPMGKRLSARPLQRAHRAGRGAPQL
jgi:hypothetical protein